MADTKISALTALAAADIAATDVLPIVDTSAATTKKITASALLDAIARAADGRLTLTVPATSTLTYSDIGHPLDPIGVLRIVHGGDTTTVAPLFLETQVCRQAALRFRLEADQTSASTTIVASTIESYLPEARHYVGRAVIRCENTAAPEGVKFTFDQGTATFTNFWASATLLAGGTTVQGTQITTDPTVPLTFSTITGDTVIALDFSFRAGTPGTLGLGFAEDSTAVGTVTVKVGSSLVTEDCGL